MKSLLFKSFKAVVYMAIGAVILWVVIGAPKVDTPDIDTQEETTEEA